MYEMIDNERRRERYINSMSGTGIVRSRRFRFASWLYNAKLNFRFWFWKTRNRGL